MAVKKRKIEYHRLTISGLGEDIFYGRFIRRIWKSSEHLTNRIMQAGGKSHSLVDVELDKRILYLRSSVHDNPLPANLTGVEWTYAVGRRLGDHYLL